MSYRTILVPVDGDTGVDDRIHAAANLARRCDAALIGVGAEPLEIDVGAGYGVIDATLIGAMQDQIDAHLKQFGARFQASAGTVDGGVTWAAAVAQPAATVAAHAGGADLIVTSRAASGAMGYSADPADLVMTCGAPLLMMPPGTRTLDAAVVLVAWKDGREARRAVADALPFLHDARRVLVVEIGDDAPEEGPSASLTAVVKRLGRHGVACEGRRIAQDGSVAETLLRAAAEAGAGLIVAGAYGHSRLREWVFGGVTKDLLAEANRPVLFSR